MTYVSARALPPHDRFSLMDFTVRRAEVEDAAAIARVQVASWRSSYTGIVPGAYLASLDAEARTADWAQHLAAGVSAFVAEDASGVFGFVCGGPAREPVAASDCELYAIYLLEGRQRRGAGSLLFLALVATLQEQGFHAMQVWVLKQNFSGVAFYQAIGGKQQAGKAIEIGGAALEELCFCWSQLGSCVP